MKYTLLLFMCLEFRQIDEGFGGWLYINTKSKRGAGSRRKVLHLRDAKKRDGLAVPLFQEGFAALCAWLSADSGRFGLHCCGRKQTRQRSRPQAAGRCGAGHFAEV